MKAVTLQKSLNYKPQVLNFGTSGRRGDVVHLTQLEIYINALAELEYLLSLSASEGGIQRGEEFFFAYDLRPSSSMFDKQLGGRGEIAQAIVQAITDAGMKPVNLGQIPTPALTYYALQQGKGSIMVTGSHIPFERNGYKVNTAKGEILKKDEVPINNIVETVRKRIYNQPLSKSLFNKKGMFTRGHKKLPPETDAARRAYIERYTHFFNGCNLAGKRLVVYQHSAVGRDILVEILEQFGAKVIPAGRSGTFVPIDTENIDDAQLSVIRQLVKKAAPKNGRIDALLSTDGDSDRPLIIAVDNKNDVRFFGGDLVGIVVAEYLGTDAVCVPISCNDAIDKSALKNVIQPKTRIGSPFVIAGMERARAKGCRRVCGWEANGGFLTGTAIERNGRILRALPTRDAMLPILCVLFSATEQKLSISDLFAKLPKRFSKAALLKNFPRATAMKIVNRFSPPDNRVKEIDFSNNQTRLLDENGKKVLGETEKYNEIRAALSKFFGFANGFGSIIKLNYTDGVRMCFNNGDVAHVRPSGNADELRIYAVAHTQSRADEIARKGVAEPNGILRSLERSIKD